MHESSSINADAVRIFIEADGIVLELGHKVTPDGSESDVIKGLSRIKLTPQTFRRFGLALHDAISLLPKESVLRSGSIPTPTPQRSSAAKASLEELLDPTINLSSSSAPTPISSQDAQRVFKLIASLGAPYVHERSFRFREGELLPNRFLLTVGRSGNGSTSDDALMDLFTNLSLPAPFLEAARQHISAARCIHVGFEGDGDSPLLKVYLEIGGPDQINQSTPDAAVLEHIAYKWDVRNRERRTVARYWWYPYLNASELKKRVVELYADHDLEAQDIALGAIEMAAQKMPERDIHYLEVEEEGNPRRSYSINFYDAGLQVRDLHTLLARMRNYFDVSPGKFQMLYDQIKTRRLGHIAGGIHRNGKGFFNVYYGPQFMDYDCQGHWRSAVFRGKDNCDF